jgi:hypothetical protein
MQDYQSTSNGSRLAVVLDRSRVRARMLARSANGANDEQWLDQNDDEGPRQCCAESSSNRSGWSDQAR